MISTLKRLENKFRLTNAVQHLYELNIGMEKNSLKQNNMIWFDFGLLRTKTELWVNSFRIYPQDKRKN